MTAWFDDVHLNRPQQPPDEAKPCCAVCSHLVAHLRKGKTLRVMNQQTLFPS